MKNIKKNLFWLILGLISIGLIYAFFKMFLFGTSVIEVSNFYYLLGTGLTLICVFLWIAHVTGIHILRSGTARAIWLTLIAGILAAGVQFYQNSLSGNHSKLKIERFLIFDESDATVEPSTTNIKTYKIRERNNTVFSQENIKIFFVALVSGFSTDSSGNIDLSNEFMILNPSEGLADFGSLPKVTNIYHWKNKCSFKEKDIKKYFGNIIGKTIFPILLSDINKKVITKEKKLILRFKITDNKTNSIAEEEIKINIH